MWSCSSVSTGTSALCGRSGLIRLANEATWQPRTRSSAIGRLTKAIGIVIAAVVLSQYLGAYGFLWSIGADPRSATPLTLARYWYYFSDRPDVRVRLQIASIGGVVLLSLVAIPAVLPRGRSLHGDARFAKRSEIA